MRLLRHRRPRSFGHTLLQLFLLASLQLATQPALGGATSSGDGLEAGGRRLLSSTTCGRCPPDAAATCQKESNRQSTTLEDILKSLLANCQKSGFSAGACCAALPSKGAQSWSYWAACMCE